MQDKIQHNIAKELMYAWYKQFDPHALCTQAVVGFHLFLCFLWEIPRHLILVWPLAQHAAQILHCNIDSISRYRSCWHAICSFNSNSYYEDCYKNRCSWHYTQDPQWSHLVAYPAPGTPVQSFTARLAAQQLGSPTYFLSLPRLTTSQAMFDGFSLLVTTQVTAVQWAQLFLL